MIVSRLVISAALIGLLCLGACSDDGAQLRGGPASTAEPIPSSGEPLPMRRFTCAVASGATSSCISAVLIGSTRRYMLTCSAADPAFVEERVVARGVVDGVDSEAHSVRGVDVELSVAVRPPPPGCPQAKSADQWLLTFRDGTKTASVNWLLCARSLPARSEESCGPRPV
jgi:hypothetical protein